MAEQIWTGWTIRKRGKVVTRLNALAQSMVPGLYPTKKSAADWCRMGEKPVRVTLAYAEPKEPRAKPKR